MLLTTDSVQVDGLAAAERVLLGDGEAPLAQLISDDELPVLVLWAAMPGSSDGDAGALEVLARLLREPEDLYLACRDRDGGEACVSLRDDAVLDGVAGLRVPAESLVALRDRADRVLNDVVEELQVALCRRLRWLCRFA